MDPTTSQAPSNGDDTINGQVYLQPGDVQSGPVDATSEPPAFDDVMQEVDANRVDQKLPPLDESISAPVNTEPDYWKPLRDRIEKGPNLTGWNFDGAGFLEDLYGIGQSMVYGLGQGAQELTRTANELGQATSAPGDAIEGLIR